MIANKFKEAWKPLIITIAFRNIIRNIDRNKFALIILLVAVAVLFVGNSVIRSVSDSFHSLYTQSLTADLSISLNDDSFTIFGNNNLLVGEFLQSPLVPEVETVVNILETSEAVNNWAGVLTLPVQIEQEIAAAAERYTALGVDFESYLRLFPDIQLVAGSFPDVDAERPSIMLQPHQYASLGSPEIGWPMLLTASNGYNFTIREVTFAGIYTYSTEDTLMSRIFLADADVIRSLSGYISQPQSLAEISPEQKELIDSEVDDLFGATSDPSPPQDENAENTLHLGDIEARLALTPERSESRAVVKEAWHFILVDIDSEYSFPQVVTEFRNAGLLQANGYRLLNWRDTAGGDAVIVFVLRILMNIGMGITIVCAAAIIMNSFALSILERRKEFAVMKALGARNKKIVFLISVEVLTMMFFCSSFRSFVGGHPHEYY